MLRYGVPAVEKKRIPFRLPLVPSERLSIRHSVDSLPIMGDPPRDTWDLCCTFGCLTKYDRYSGLVDGEPFGLWLCPGCDVQFEVFLGELADCLDRCGLLRWLSGERERSVNYLSQRTFELEKNFDQLRKDADRIEGEMSRLEYRLYRLRRKLEEVIP